jgi:predicted RNase H-like nuclease (RuvC/YqgF family)
MSESAKTAWDWYQVFQVIWAIVSGAVGWGLWREGRRQAKEKKEQQQEEAHRAATDKRLDKLERDTQDLQNEVRHLPTHEDIRQLTEKIEGTNTALSEVIGAFRAMNRTVQMVNQHLISRGE